MARRSKKETLRSRENILKSAARLFRQNGYEGAGLDEIMRTAGLTVGTFYSHFSSKMDLFEEVLTFSARSARLKMMGDCSINDQPKQINENEKTWIKQLFSAYLSDQHKLDVGCGCPLSVLGSDVSRLNKKSRKTFEKMIYGFFSDSESLVNSSLSDKQLVSLCLSVGALTLARAVSSPALSKKILQSARNAVDHYF